MSCPHMDFRARVNVGRIVKEENNHMGASAPVEVFALEVEVECSQCGQPFKFDWDVPADPDIVPLGTDGMKRRPWTTFDRSTLGASISPLDRVVIPEELRDVKGSA